ncbi:MAG: Ig-like domain-containing protein, partial [Phycisphaerales bacterium]|nr:Ig-like domain-containing protein [Phycisphaerales bacterium]
WSNYMVTATIRCVGTNSVGILFRFRDPLNHYRLEVDGARNRRQLVKVVDGAQQVLASEEGAFPDDAQFDLRIAAANDQISCRLGSIPLFGGVTADGALGSGTFGLYTWNGGQASFERIVVAPAGRTPSVVVTAPQDGAIVPAFADLLLSAEASNIDGGVSRIEFLNGEAVIGAAAAAPYQVIWTSVPAGTYAIRARAVTIWNQFGVSEPIAVRVANRVQTHQPGSLRPEFLGIRQLSNGTFGIVLVGNEGETITVERSFDLRLWQTVTDVTVSGGFAQADETLPAGRKQVFYRARTATAGTGTQLPPIREPSEPRLPPGHQEP